MIQNLLSKYRNLSKPVKASLWFVVSNIFLKGISFITLPIFSRLLSTSEYGIVSVYSSWVALVSIITTLTIWGDVFEVELAKQSDNSIISSFQGLATFITCSFLIVSILVLDKVSAVLGISEFLVCCMYLEVLAQIPLNLWLTERRCNFEYKSTIAITSLIAVLNPLIGVVAVIHSPYKAEARIISNLSIHLVLGIATFIINQKKGKAFFDKERWEYAFHSSIVLVPHYLSTQVLNQSDRVMINRLCSSSDAGIYSVAYNFAMLLQLVTNGIHASLTPHIYRSLSNHETKKLGKQITGITFMVAVITLALICVIPDVFKWMLPESYYEALWVIPPLAASAFFMFVYPLFASIEFYYGENKGVTTASLICAIVNIILNYAFVKVFGFIAAAYTTLICYILFSVCHYFFMKWALEKNNIQGKVYDIKSLSVISVAVILISIGIVPLYERYAIRWGITLCIVIIAVIYRKRIFEIFKNLH